MSKKKSPYFSTLVYSTDPSFTQQNVKEIIITLPVDDQPLKVSVDKKQRAGKVVTLVAGFAGKEEDLEQLSKELKSFCGTGGSVKDGLIIIQGNNLEKIYGKLLNNGYKKVKKT